MTTFSALKCPQCGAPNSIRSITCAACGSALVLIRSFPQNEGLEMHLPDQLLKGGITAYLEMLYEHGEAQFGSMTGGDILSASDPRPRRRLVFLERLVTWLESQVEHPTKSVEVHMALEHARVLLLKARCPFVAYTSQAWITHFHQHLEEFPADARNALDTLFTQIEGTREHDITGRGTNMSLDDELISRLYGDEEVAQVAISIFYRDRDVMYGVPRANASTSKKTPQAQRQWWQIWKKES